MPFLLNTSSMANINVCNWLMAMENKTLIMENEGSLRPCIFRLDSTKDGFFFFLNSFSLYIYVQILSTVSKVFTDIIEISSMMIPSALLIASPSFKYCSSEVNLCWSCSVLYLPSNRPKVWCTIRAPYFWSYKLAIPKFRGQNSKMYKYAEYK